MTFDRNGLRTSEGIQTVHKLWDALYYRQSSSHINLISGVVVTARKRSLGQGNIFAPVCYSVHRGWVCLIACWNTSPPDQRQAHPPPPKQAHPPREQTTPQSRPPPGADTLPRSRHPPPGAHPRPPQCMLGDTCNKRAVRILLECNLVFCRRWRAPTLASPSSLRSSDGFTTGTSRTPDRKRSNRSRIQVSTMYTCTPGADPGIPVMGHQAFILLFSKKNSIKPAKIWSLGEWACRERPLMLTLPLFLEKVNGQCFDASISEAK